MVIPWMLKSQEQRLEAVFSPDLFFWKWWLTQRKICRCDRKEFDVLAQHLSDIVLAVIPFIGNDLITGDI